MKSRIDGQVRMMGGEEDIKTALRKGFLSFLNKFIYFNWRLIALKYCSG